MAGAERRLAALAFALAAAALPAGADTAASAVVTYERVRLPGDEGLGLASLSYLVEPAPGWWLGPALYGAAHGQRGGLFTWGLEGQRRWRLGGRWHAAAGLYVGGGGGAAAPVGGGLMLRPHAEVLHDFGGWSLGLGLAHVRFPTGEIGSTQLAAVLTVDDVFTPSERQFFQPERLVLTGGALRDAPGRVGFLVLRSEQPVNRWLAGSLETGAAVSGAADGYAEFLAGLVGLWPAAGAPVRVGGRVAAGLGGGGAVPTGGGVIGKAALLGRVQLPAGWSVELEAGRQRAADGDLDSPYAALGLAIECCRRAADTEWSLGLQHYAHAERRDGRDKAMQTLGLKLRESIGGGWYATGQAFGGIAGGAGAYSAGVLGAGWRTPLDAAGRWRAGAEALVGAAGGGGVSSRGGAVVQPMAWVDVSIGATRLQAGAGVLRSLRGELATPVVELSWVVPLGVR